MKKIIVAATIAAFTLSAPTVFAANAKKVGLVGGVVAGAVVGGPVGAVVGGVAGVTTGAVIDDTHTGSVKKRHHRDIRNQQE